MSPFTPRRRSSPLLRVNLSALTLSLSLAFSLAPTAALAQQTVSIQIQAQPLGDALLQLGEQTSLQIFFSQDVVAGRHAPAISGRLAPEQALRQLLHGSGINYAKDGNTITLSAGVAQLTPVTIRRAPTDTSDSYTALRSRSGKLDTPLIETPRSISIVTQKQLKILAPQSIERALAYTPGVQTDVSGSGDLRMSGAVIRGFSDGSAYYKDGLKQLSAGTYGSWNDDMDSLDSIEVLKGPASVLYGQGRPGGVVNVVSKRPTVDHVNSLGLGYGSYQRRQLTADIGGALNDDQSLLYRLNFSGRKSHGRTIDSRDDRISVSPSLLWKLSDRTSLTLLGSYSKERGTPKSWWPNLFYYPEVTDLPLKRTAGDPAFDYFNRDTKAIGYALEHDTESGWRLRQNLRYAEIDIDYRHIYAMAVLADQRSVSRASLAQETKGRTFTVDSRAGKDFNWGAVEHTLEFGVDYLRYKENDSLGFGWNVPDLDMLNPVYGLSIAPPEMDYSERDLKQTGVYMLNQLKWDQWIANVSLRHDTARIVQSSATQPRMTDRATTGSAGLLYLFDNGVAPYISYSTAFDPTTGRAADGTAFKPREGKQYEAGVKYQPPGTDALITAAVFDLRQTNVTTPDPSFPRFSVQTGEVRSTGIELEAKLPITSELNVMAGYTYLDPRTTQSERPAEIDRQTLQTARQTASLWLDYRPQQIQGLMLGAGVRYRGKSPNDVRPDGSLNYNPSFTLADMAIAYETSRYRVALNVNNVFNKKYYTGQFRGMEREVMLNMNLYW